MTEIKSGSEFTASRALLEKMREFATNQKDANGQVDLSKNQITKDEIEQLKALASADAAGLTEDERKLIDGLDSTSQNDTATVEHNISELNKDLKAANQVDFASMKLRSQSTSFFGLFRSTYENTVKLSDSHIPSVENPNTNVSMQERSALEQENLKQMMQPFENALNAQPPSQEIMERMALMVDPPLDLKSSPNMSEEQSKLMREMAEKRIEQLQTDPELRKATLAKVAEMKAKIAAYKQNPSEAFRPMYESYCQLATGYAVLPPTENSLFSKGYIAALNGANYNVLETNKQALNHKEAIQNGEFITPNSIEQINQTQAKNSQTSRDKIMPMLTDATDLIAKLDDLKQSDPTAYNEMMQGFGTEDLDVLKVRLQEFKQYMEAQPPRPITQAQMSQLSYIEGSLVRLRYQTKLESLNAPSQRQAAREQTLKDQASAQAILDDPTSSPEAKAEAEGNLQMCKALLTELDKSSSQSPQSPALQSLSAAYQKLYGEADKQSFLAARDSVRETVSTQSQMLAELEHVEQSINQLMTRSDLNLDNRKSLEAKLAAIQEAKAALMQGQPIDIKDPGKKEAFAQVLGMLNQVRESNQIVPDLTLGEDYGSLFSGSTGEDLAFGYDPLCYFDLDYDFSSPFSLDGFWGNSNQKVQDLLLDDLKTRQANLKDTETISSVSDELPLNVSKENEELYKSLLTIRNSPGVDDKTKACLNVALEQLSDPSLTADSKEIQSIKQLAGEYEQLKQQYGSNAANLAFMNAIKNLFPGNKTPNSLEIKQLLAQNNFVPNLQAGINSFINDDAFINQAKDLRDYSADELEYMNLTELLNNQIPGLPSPLSSIITQLKTDGVAWDEKKSIADNIQNLPPEAFDKYFKDSEQLKTKSADFEKRLNRMQELERKAKDLSGKGLSDEDQNELNSIRHDALLIAQLKALDKFGSVSQTVKKQDQQRIDTLNSTLGNLQSQLGVLESRVPPVDGRVLGPLKAQIALMEAAQAKLARGEQLSRREIGDIAVATALSDANTRILKYVQLNPNNPQIESLYKAYQDLLNRPHGYSGQDITALMARFDRLTGVNRPTDENGDFSSFNFEQKADATYTELGGHETPAGPDDGPYTPASGDGHSDGDIDFSSIKYPPDSGPLRELCDSLKVQNNYIGSLTGEERRKALEDAIEVGEIMNRAFNNFSKGKIESDEEFARHIKEQNDFNKSQLEAVLGSKQSDLIQKADQDENNLNLAPMPEISGDQHFSQWLAETLKIIRNWDEKERQAFMAALALKMMDEVIRAFYKDQQDRSMEHHEEALSASREHSQELVRSTQQSRDFGSVGNDQAVAALSGQGRASDRSEAFNTAIRMEPDQAPHMDPQAARQTLLGMIQSARTGEQRLHISAADEQAILAKFDTLMLAASTPGSEDDRQALLAMTGR